MRVVSVSSTQRDVWLISQIREEGGRCASSMWILGVIVDTIARIFTLSESDNTSASERDS